MSGILVSFAVLFLINSFTFDAVNLTRKFRDVNVSYIGKIHITIRYFKCPFYYQKHDEF